MQKLPENTVVLDHSVINHRLTRLRQRNTPFSEFRTIIDDISLFMFYEATRKLATVERDIETPLEKMTAQQLKNEVLLVPILRAGLGMVNGIQRVFGEARVGMIGMYRDHTTLQPVDYYLRFPEKISDMDIFLLDPMLATGGSASAAVSRLRDHGAENITMLAILSAPEGIANLAGDHPDINIYTAALDRQLNDKGYILPGLGDAGDRYFGTDS